MTLRAPTFLPVLVVLAVGVLTTSCASAVHVPADSCALLSAPEIGQVIGEAPVEASNTTHSSGGVTVSQCFYRLPNYVDSVTLELTTPDDPRTLSTREIWEQRFADREDRDASSERERAAGDEAEAEEERERESESGEPRRFVSVANVGDEAAWAGNRVSGALYVRTRATVLRISIGGTGGAEDKMEKSKRLARAALSRLR